MFFILLFKNILFTGVSAWLIFQPCLIDALQEKHHFFYRFTVLSKAENSSDFTAEAVADDRQIRHYNTEVESWKGVNLFKNDRTEPLPEPYEPRDWYRDQLKIVANCTECSELHILQRIIGCKLERDAYKTVINMTVFDEYGFDGKDLMAFHYDTLQWTDKSPNAKEIKRDWDCHTERKRYLYKYLKDCMDWISKFNTTNKTSPDVYVFARKVPDDHSKLNLSCLVTGFYPKDVEMNIRLNRVNLKNQISSGIRPNNDETFQMRSSVKIDRNHRGSYDCFVIHSSLTEPVSVKWEKPFNGDTRTRWPMLATILLAAVACAVYIKKRKESNESFPAIRRNNSSYGAVSEQILKTECADTSDEELSVDGSTD